MKNKSKINLKLIKKRKIAKIISLVKKRKRIMDRLPLQGLHNLYIFELSYR